MLRPAPALSEFTDNPTSQAVVRLAVSRQLARGMSRSERLDECIGLLASIEGCFRIAGHPPGYLIRLRNTQRKPFAGVCLLMSGENRVIACRAATKNYDSKPVLRGIHLVVEPGICALLGANGAGKSTLLRLLSGLEEPDSVPCSSADWVSGIMELEFGGIWVYYPRGSGCSSL